MHEATIAESILKLLQTKLNQIPEAAAIVSARVVVGEFRNIDQASLAFAFNGMKTTYEGLAGCELEIECIPAQAWCHSRRHRYHPDFSNAYRCSCCGDSIGELIQGKELYIVGMVMDSISPLVKMGRG